MASPSARVLLVLRLFQISSALPRSCLLYDKHVTAMRRLHWKGVLSTLNPSDIFLFRFIFMCSRCLVAGGVMLAFRPVFAPVAGALYPGKEDWPFPLVETRQPLSLEGLTHSKDISSWGLNLWESVRLQNPVTLSVEATAPPQADWIGNLPSWASSHLSLPTQTLVTTNYQRHVCPLHVHGVAHDEQMQALPSPQDNRRYGLWAHTFALLLVLLAWLFPALFRAIVRSPWMYMSPSESIEHTASSDDLTAPYPDDQLDDSSDEDNDAVTSYNGSGPSSPIQSFGQSLQLSEQVHPDNSQFSTMVSIGTPNILRTAHSNVTASPSLIRDARLAAAPYSTPGTKAGSGPSSRQASAPPSRPPSHGPSLPTTAAAFGLKPSKTVSLSLVPKTPITATSMPPPPPASSPKVYPEINKVLVEIPLVLSTLAGIVPQEWAIFHKHVLDYNLSCDLYKADLDWKKANPQEPQDVAAVADYHLNIGRVNQCVGAIALMERVLGQYICTVGPDLVLKQAQSFDLALSKSDIDWLLQQAAKDTGTLLRDDGVPQEDLAPALFLAPLQATPAPTASLELPVPMPLSSLTSLPLSPKQLSLNWPPP